jgi:hypothetical protein
MKPIRDWPWTHILLALLLIATLMNYLELLQVAERLQEVYRAIRSLPN